jgi:phosphoglycolate phosphatase-like HAD superfamily hydrolase
LEQNNDKRVLPGVLELLDLLNHHPKVINALLTSNLKVGAHSKLNALGLGGYFDMGGYGDEPGDKWDAAERCIELAEHQNGTLFQREKIFLIGDSCYDIIAANKCGIMSIAVATGWADADSLQGCHPDYFFPDLSDTKRVLSIITG